MFWGTSMMISTVATLPSHQQCIGVPFPGFSSWVQNLDVFLCKVRDLDVISFFCMWCQIFSASFIKEVIFLPAEFGVLCLESDTCDCRSLFLGPLIQFAELCVSFCASSLMVFLLQFGIRYCNSSSIILLAWGGLGYLESSVLPHVF